MEIKHQEASLVRAGFLSRGLLNFSPRQAGPTRAAFLYGTYANWGSSCLAAGWGTSRLTPLSGAGFSSAPSKETVVQALQVSLALAILGGAVSVLHALRRKPVTP